jgi:exopolysaccharide biosynthesis polyprenyl glycosylphosphotransferase
VARRAESERCLVIGDAATYARLQSKFDTHQVPAELVGRLSMQRATGRPSERPVDETLLRQLVEDLDVHRIIIAPSQTQHEMTLDLVRAAKGVGVRVSLLPHVFDVVGTAVVFDHIAGMTLLGVRRFGLSRSSRAVKRSFDLAGSLAILLLVAPVLAALAAAIRLDSPGSVFFRQERVGKDGRRFRIFKFRTMCADAEARKADLMDHNEASGLFKIADDPRITRVGRFLRKTSLDELPQLFNVVRGEMSLVGPRPLILCEDETIKGYDRRRLSLTPGMTGHWQILGSARVPLAEMVKIDYLYVAGWSLWSDMKILLRTVLYVAARKNA